MDLKDLLMHYQNDFDTIKVIKDLEGMTKNGWGSKNFSYRSYRSRGVFYPAPSSN